MVQKCIVPHCKSYNGDIDKEKGGPVSFHKFPVDPIIRAEWVRRSGRVSDWEPSAHSRMCSKHFTLDCYRLQSHDQNSTRRHKRAGHLLNQWLFHDDAIPTIFEPYMHSCSAGECYRTPTRCAHCEHFEAFSEKDLKYHLSAVHVRYFPFGCDHCLNDNKPTWLATGESLELHTAMKHFGLDAEVKDDAIDSNLGLNLQTRVKRDKRKENQLARMLAEFEKGNKGQKITKADREAERDEVKAKSGAQAQEMQDLKLKKKVDEFRKWLAEKESKTAGRKPQEATSCRYGTRSTGIDLLLTAAQDKVKEQEEREDSERPSTPPDAEIDVEGIEESPEICAWPDAHQGDLEPKVPRLSFAQEFVERTSAPENIPVYVHPRRRADKMPTISVHDAASRILAGACSKPKIPARYSLAQMRKMQTDSATDGSKESIEIKQESLPPGPKSIELRPVTRNRQKHDNRKISFMKRLHLESLRKAKEERMKQPRKPTKSELNRTENRKNTLLFTCSECDASVFRTKDHVISKHLSGEMFTCEHCYYTSGCHRIMRRHLALEHPDRERKIEVNHDLEEELINKHLEYFGFDYRTVKFECRLCNSLISFGDTMAAHRASHREFAVKCGVCSAIFDNRDVFIEHHGAEHPAFRMRYQIPGPMELQNACFPVDSQPLGPDCIEGRNVRRPPCRMSMDCLKCGRKVAVYDAVAHARGHATVTSSYCCPYCSFSHAVGKTIKAHIQRMHPQREQFPLAPPNKETAEENRALILEAFGFNMVECDYCHKPVSFWNLRLHVSEHLEELRTETGETETVDFGEMAQRCYAGVIHVN